VTQSGDAPFFSKTLMTFKWPWCVAWCRGV